MINYFNKLINDLICELNQYGFAITNNKKAAEQVRVAVSVIVTEKDGYIYMTKEE